MYDQIQSSEVLAVTREVVEAGPSLTRTPPSALSPLTGTLALLGQLCSPGCPTAHIHIASMDCKSISEANPDIAGTGVSF
jgi:hypothetical protein